LIDRIDDAHDDLRHALGEDVLIQLARPLSDEADTHTEFSSLAKDLLQNICRYHACPCWREAMCLFQKREDRVIQEILTFIGVAAYGHHPGLIHAAEHCADDHLLFMLFDVA